MLGGGGFRGSTGCQAIGKKLLLFVEVDLQLLFRYLTGALDMTARVPQQRYTAFTASPIRPIIFLPPVSGCPSQLGADQEAYGLPESCPPETVTLAESRNI